MIRSRDSSMVLRNLGHLRFNRSCNVVSKEASNLDNSSKPRLGALKVTGGSDPSSIDQLFAFAHCPCQYTSTIRESYQQYKKMKGKKLNHPLSARIKKIMQADEDVGKIAQATPVLLGTDLIDLHKQNWLG